MINFSILLPTRGRPSSVRRLFESIVKTAHDIQSVEIVLYMDADDVASHNIDMPALKIVKIIKPPGNSMGMIFKECYQKSSGHYIMLMNDDAVFRSEGWDKAVSAAFSNFSDDIVFVYGNDMDQGERSPTFPVLSRKVCELMGGICPEGYLNLHIESHLFDIFKQLKHFGYDRTVYLNDVVFEHLHHVVGKSKQDKTYVKRDPSFDDRLFISLNTERKYVAMKLAQHIEKQKNDKVEYLDDNVNKGKKSHSELKPDVSIIIPHFLNNGESLFRYLNKNNDQIRFEAIIISSGSADTLPSYILNLREKINIVYDKKNSSVAGMYNHGVRHARGDYLIFINGGAYPMPGLIDKMMDMAKTNNDIGIVGCKHINPRNGRIHHAGMAFFNDAGKFKMTCLYRGVQADNPVVNRVREFQAVSAACMLVKKDVFLDAGGFDENMKGVEDIDLCFNIRKNGKKIVYLPQAVIYYDGCLGINDYTPHDLYFIEAKWGSKVEYDLEKLLSEDSFYLHKKENIYYISPK